MNTSEPPPLERWARAGLISEDQRAEIESFEEHGGPLDGRHVLLSEALVYVGIAGLLASLSGILGRVSPGARGLILAALVVITGAAGAALLATGTKALSRAACFLWFLSVLFAAGIGAYLSGSGHRGVVRPLLLAGLPSFSLAMVYWLFNKTGTQLFAAFASGLLVIYGIANALAPVTPTTGGLLLAAIGVAGLGATTRGWVGPTDAADHLFGLSITVGLFIPGLQTGGTWAEIAAAVAAALLMWLSVEWRSSDLLYVGTLSLIVIGITGVGRHFMGTLGIPLMFLLVGSMLIVRAILVAHVRSGARDG